jgi:hypothetical protein
LIKPAQLFTTELKVKFWEIAYDLHYMFVYQGYTDDYNPSSTTWGDHEFVSVSKDGKVLGYIGYGINQRSGVVSNFCAINFSNSVIFARDLYQVIDDIFCKYKYNKLKYGVFVGNPIEKTYDKLTERYGGRIVGINEKDAKLMDGIFHDYKSYELHRENYLINRHLILR